MTVVAAVELTPVERSRKILQTLILERRALRFNGADRATLEANRLAIVYWQQHLARALNEPRDDARSSPS